MSELGGLRTAIQVDLHHISCPLICHSESEGPEQFHNCIFKSFSCKRHFSYFQLHFGAIFSLFFKCNDEMQKLFFIASNAAYFEYMMIRTSSVIRFQEFRGYKK